jgi:hypothetical protein
MLIPVCYHFIIHTVPSCHHVSGPYVTFYSLQFTLCHCTIMPSCYRDIILSCHDDIMPRKLHEQFHQKIYYQPPCHYAIVPKASCRQNLSELWYFTIMLSGFHASMTCAIKSSNVLNVQCIIFTVMLSC